MQQENWKKQIKDISVKLNMDENSQLKMFEDYCDSIKDSILKKVVNTDVTCRYDKKKDICRIEIASKKYPIKYFYSCFDISRKVCELMDPMAVGFGVVVNYKRFVLEEFFS